MEPRTTEAPVLELLELSVDPPSPPSSATTQPARRPLLVAIGVVAALLAAAAYLVIRPDSDAAALAVALPDTTPAPPQPPAGIEGFTELYVASYVAGEGAMPLRHFYAGAPDPSRPAATRFVRHVATLSVVPEAPKRWLVGVVADILVYDGVGYRPQGVLHFTVGVLETPNGFAATGLPVLVPAPPPAPFPSGREMAPVDDASLVALVDGFLAAYLAGTGDLRAYVAPGAGIQRITPAPFDQVALDELVGTTLDDGAIWLRALATARDSHGAMAIEQHLVVTGDGGTWAVERLEAGALPRPPG